MSEAKIKKEVKKQAEIFEINVKNGLYAVRRMKFSEYEQHHAAAGAGGRHQ